MHYRLRQRVWQAALIACAALAGCDAPEAPKPQPRAVPEVYTTFYPTTYFARRIAGERVKVVCPIPAGEDPIFWMPSPEVLGGYQQADLIVINGAGFEKWIAKVSLSPSKLVDTAAPLAEQFIQYTEAATHSHGPGGKHSHEGLDGHTWLDPKLAQAQADEIRKALARRLPEHKEEFQSRYAALAADLDGLARDLAELSGKLGETPLLASHPAYNYLAKRYGWQITNLDLDPRAMPPAGVLAQIKKATGEDKARIILWESPPLPAIADKLRGDFDLTSVEFSPCELLADADAQAGLDYLKVMHRNIARLTAAMAK